MDEHGDGGGELLNMVIELVMVMVMVMVIELVACSIQITGKLG